MSQHAVRTWRRLNVLDAHDLLRRWRAAQGAGHHDSLLDGQADPSTVSRNRFTWSVQSELDLVRLVGALQHMNPRCTLWFRGEHKHHPEIKPSRARIASGERDRVGNGLDFLDTLGLRQRMVRDRGPLARLAILQHYGIPTSFLDVTRDLRVALFFALFDPRPSDTVGAPPTVVDTPDPHVLVFATPRLVDAVSDFVGADLCVVDLLAEMPSYALRPHVQQAAFIGVRAAVYSDLEGHTCDDSVDLRDACIARIKIAFREPGLGSRVTHLLPPASATCGQCPAAAGAVVADSSFDTMLHVLACGCHDEAGTFPSFNWQPAVRTK